MVVRGGIGGFGFERRTTEVMAVSNFNANIQRISENANSPDRNFTVFVVKTPSSVVFLNSIQAIELVTQYSF